MSHVLKWIFCIATLLVLAPLSLLLGSVDIPLTAFLGDADELQRMIIYESRIPRTVAAILAGVGLSVGGLFMQTLFRNPLAGPSVLGLTSGSSMAVALLTLGGGVWATTQFSIVVAASLGALAVLLVILAVAHRFVDISSVLIVGLMLSFFTSAMVSLLQTYADETSLKTFVFWGFGSFSNVASNQLIFFLIPIVAILLFTPFLIKPLNHLLLGTMHAKTMGVNVSKLQLLLVVSTGIMVGVITAFCGPVAFIGLAVPHLARLLFSTPDHRTILPASMVIGAVVALFCDLIARMPYSEFALPLNTVCAFMGAPVVIYLVFKGRKSRILS
jgi:iron complex transport system permease protein